MAGGSNSVFDARSEAVESTDSLVDILISDGIAMSVSWALACCAVSVSSKTSLAVCCSGISNFELVFVWDTDRRPGSEEGSLGTATSFKLRVILAIIVSVGNEFDVSFAAVVIWLLESLGFPTTGVKRTGTDKMAEGEP